MRFRVRRLLGVSALYLIFGLQLPGCSGQQQEEEGLEVSGQENEAAENEAAANEAANEATDNQAAEDNASAEEGGNEAGNEETANANENATENDLQEIIQEMNGQQTDTAAAETGDAAALQQDLAAPAQPADAAATAAAPMMDAGAASAAPAAPSTAAIPFQPGGSPAAPGLPEIGSKMAYIVEAGDTMGKISQKIYGTPGRWQELASLSGMSNPSRIYPGDLVYYTLDESAVAFATAYESIQRSSETVQPGDTLATIAQRIYGSTTAWRSLWRHNDKIDNPDIVATGTTVYYLPKGALSAAINKTKSQLGHVAKATVKTNKTVAKSNINKIKTNAAKVTKAVKNVNNGIKVAGSKVLENITIANMNLVPCV